MESNYQSDGSKMGEKSSIHPALLVLILVILVALGYFVVKNNVGKVSTPKFSTENVEIKATDFSKAEGENKLPAGFLQSIPVELNGITESNTLSYPDQKVVLYSVSYASTKTMSVLSATYSDFFKTNKYTVTKSDITKARVIYTATKDKTEINIMITPQPKNQLVQISYVVRQ